MLEKIDIKLNIKSFDELLELAKKSSDEALDGSSLLTRASKKINDALHVTLAGAGNAADVVAQKIKLNFKAFQKYDYKQKFDDKSVLAIINWLVELFKDVIKRINDQGEILAFLVAKVSEIVEHKDTNVEELLREKQTELESALEEILKHQQATLENEMKEKTEDLQKEIKNKCDTLEKKCDEARQRGLKGNLIVSSPERRTARGPVSTLAVKESWQDPHHGMVKEDDLEMILRLVHRKTNISIPRCDVAACHPIGKRDSHTYVLCVANRTPGSAWDALTKGLATGENFSWDNIFINYQLTKRRGELSKEVRKAKAAKLIEKYSIDANSRIFAKKVGDNKKHEIVSIDALKTLTGTGE